MRAQRGKKFWVEGGPGYVRGGTQRGETAPRWGGDTGHQNDYIAVVLYNEALSY